jgi:hypothetical protein
MGIEGDAEPSEQSNHQPFQGEQPSAQRERFWDLKASHWVEVFLTVVLICVGYLQYTVYTRQAGIMDQQTRIAQAEHRPWISANSPQFAGDLIHDATGLRIGIEFPLKNTGHSPARNVLIDLRASLYGWNGDTTFRNICANLEKFPFGASIFPGDAVPQRAFGLIPEAEFLQRQEEAKGGAQIEHVPPTITVCIVTWKTRVSTIRL